MRSPGVFVGDVAKAFEILDIQAVSRDLESLFKTASLEKRMRTVYVTHVNVLNVALVLLSLFLILTERCFCLSLYTVVF